MKLPSIEYLLISSKESFLRFPLVIISSLISVTVGIYLTEYHEDITDIFPYINLMLCTSLGIPLYFSGGVFSSKRGLGTVTKVLLSLLITIVLVAIFFSLPASDSTHNTTLPYIRYSIYVVTAHLLVSFIPFITNKQLNGFWHYNKILFIRFWVSVLFSGILYLGLIMALGSLKLLFDIKVHEELFMDFFIVIIGFFNTWFFVAGIPDNFNELDEITEYPKGLKLFSQYILLPLLALYLVILYAYGIRILVLWNWPKGIVSYLIICVSILGILTFLLIYPYGNLKDNHWIKKASKGYYFVLFPLIVILFMAIIMRINDYGLTINRYLIVFLGVWLIIVCTYTALGKTNIKFIPISLALILIVISFGPWGVFSVSEKNQVNRLKRILEQSKILKNNKINNEVLWVKDSLPHFYSIKEATNEGILADSLHNEVKSILDYLYNNHGFSLINDLYSQNLDSMINLSHSKEKNKWNKVNGADIYMRSLGLDYKYVNTKNKYEQYEFNTSESDIINVKGFDYLVKFDYFYYGSRVICSFNLDTSKYTLRGLYDSKNKLLLENGHDTIDFEINELVTQLKKEYGENYELTIPASKMELYKTTELYEMKVAFDAIGLLDSAEINHLKGNLFIKNKQ